MAADDLSELRRKYRSAYTNYMYCIKDVAEASKRRERPPDQVLATEDRAFNDLAVAREVLLKALRQCDRPHPNSG